MKIAIIGKKSFNSNLVRLKVFRAGRWGMSGICFNSNLVRLKGRDWLQVRDVSRGFNSNLVRLKDPPSWFPDILRECFNSNLVRLKGECFGVLGGAEPCFNSNLVRLKARAALSHPPRHSWFQFQSGAIKGKRPRIIKNP